MSEYTCKDCGKDYESLGGLRRHIRRRTCEFRHNCPGCGWGCLTEEGLKRHASKEHDASLAGEDRLRELYIEQDMTQAEVAEVLECGDATVSRWLADFGISKESPGKDRVCMDCGEDYASLDSLRPHVRRSSCGFRYNCPTCDKGYLTEEGMKIHSSREHDISLRGDPETCKWCGDDFRADVAYGTEFCSRGCREIADVQKHAVRLRVLKCEQCGDECRVKPSREDSFRFCSTRCKGDWLSENRVGEDHPCWKGNGEGVQYYGPDWHEQRHRALRRDQYRCQMCGATTAELGQTPDTHHITPLKSFDGYEAANRLENLISLCSTCHTRMEQHAPLLPQAAD